MGKKKPAAVATEGAEGTESQVSKYQAYFDANPKADTLYVSSDEQVFTHEGWCKSHVKFLEDKAITEVYREADDADSDDESEEEDTTV